MKSIEIEKTTPLSAPQHKRLRKYLQENFNHTGDYTRFMVRFVKDKVDVRNPLDIRYKWTSGHNELVIKKGALGSQKREEVHIPLADFQLEQFAHLFKLLEYKKGLAIYRELEKFENEKLEITLGKAGKFLFAEAESRNTKDRKEALKKVDEFFHTTNLTPLTKAEYQKYLRMIDREVNFHFNLNNYPNQLRMSPYWKKILQKIK